MKQFNYEYYIIFRKANGTYTEPDKIREEVFRKLIRTHRAADITDYPTENDEQEGIRYWFKDFSLVEIAKPIKK